MANTNNQLYLRLAALIVAVGLAAMSAVAYTHVSFVGVHQYDVDQNRVEEAINSLHDDIKLQNEQMLHLLRDIHSGDTHH